MSRVVQCISSCCARLVSWFKASRREKFTTREISSVLCNSTERFPAGDFVLCQSICLPTERNSENFKVASNCVLKRFFSNLKINKKYLNAPKELVITPLLKVLSFSGCRNFQLKNLPSLSRAKLPRSPNFSNLPTPRISHELVCLPEKLKT